MNKQRTWLLNLLIAMIFVEQNWQGAVELIQKFFYLLEF